MPECDGSVETLSQPNCDGSILRLTCCPPPAPQEQQLVKRWMQTRGGTFNTTPIPYGRSSFSTTTDFGIAGPPPPGGDSTRISLSGFTPLDPEGPPKTVNANGTNPDGGFGEY